MEHLLVVTIAALFTGAGLWIYLVLLGRAEIRDRAALAVYAEIRRRLARHEQLMERGFETPLLERYRRYHRVAARELARLGFPADPAAR